MKPSIQMSIASAVLSLMFASDALAGEWTRTGPNGGTATRTYEAGSGVTVDRTGPNGGSSSASVTCQRVGGVRCDRSFTATGADGRTVSGDRTSNRGPFRRRSATTVTGPDGNTVTRLRAGPRFTRPARVHRHWLR